MTAHSGEGQWLAKFSGQTSTPWEVRSFNPTISAITSLSTFLWAMLTSASCSLVFPPWDPPLYTFDFQMKCWVQQRPAIRILPWYSFRFWHRPTFSFNSIGRVRLSSLFSSPLCFFIPSLFWTFRKSHTSPFFLKNSTCTQVQENQASFCHSELRREKSAITILKV